LIDDLRSLHYKYKVLVQIIASIFVSVGGSTLLSYFSVFYLSMFTRIIVFSFVTLWIFAITTSFNIIDGIDGLADGIAVVSSLAFAVAGLILNQPIVVFVSVVILGSSLGFLRYNFPPAKIFMGDSGSLFLGFLFGLISLLLLISGEDIFLKIAGSIFILTIPLLDTTLAFLRRLISARPVFEADLKHMHHLLLIRFESMLKVDFILWGLTLLFSIFGILTMMGYVAAFIIAIFLEIALFTFSLTAMMRMKASTGNIDEILKKCRATSSTASERED
ncbi:undecaprenyl/decaprenyl-phosphate alpha-N-acetylglucosaminyl 1-phosphate transferase, partial [bacterium]|nr:undecaprenyl/decaprenyl-phosphate alpha-N-acetylglucosaminyl 1-phosphate transferase [bacterium]